ncbi:MAG TPA: hypothetical protein PK814_03340, partial [Syntrophales bacterium]|nr:hypothetical protein [Syntrophales bacterium]HPK17888.1 hypothetical protein [Syntrophales bacterium]
MAPVLVSGKPPHIGGEARKLRRAEARGKSKTLCSLYLLFLSSALPMLTALNAENEDMASNVGAPPPSDDLIRDDLEDLVPRPATVRHL